MFSFRRLLVFGVAIAVAPFVLAAPYDAVVTGANDPTFDVPAVQAAVDAGGRVLMIGTFDFGPNGSVAITTDVQIEGRAGPDGRPATLLRRGFLPFYIDAPASVALRTIRFEETLGAAVVAWRATGIEVSGTEIVNVRPDATWWGPGVLATAGILVSPSDPGELTSRVVIRGNFVRLNPDPGRSAIYDAQHGHGIEVSFVGGDVEIVDNVVENTGCNAITAFDVAGRTVISGNVVTPGPDQLPWNSVGNGIFLGAFWGTTTRGEVVVTRNTIHCVHPLADGILLDDWFPDAHGDALIQKNVILMEGSTCCGGITLGESASRTSVLQNRVEGTMVYALGAGPGYGVALASNAFLGNNFARAQVEWCHVVLGQETFRNVVNGSCGDAVDLGIENTLAGVGRKDVPLGPAIKEAMARKHDLARTSR